MHKAGGYVRDVFRTRNMRDLLGHVGIGHCRYPTAGSASSELESQPFYVNSPFGITLAHNGNLTNSEALKRELFQLDFRHVNTNSDSEVLLNVLALELERAAHHARLDADAIFTAVAGVHRRCRGAYAIVALIAGYGLVAFRDPFGIRPLIVGVNEAMGGTEYRRRERVGRAGGAGLFGAARRRAGRSRLHRPDRPASTRGSCADNAVLAPCIFEYVYLARPDSVIDGTSVYESRLNMGEQLAHKIRGIPEARDIDVVIPIPDSSRPSALQLANTLGLTYREGFVKNRYIGRTFIMPGQALRKKSVRQKLNPIGMEFKDKVVLLVDDSIVRGTTSREIVQMAREAGAKQGVFRVREPAGALSERLRDRHAEPAASSSPPAARKPRSRARSARTSSSTRISTRSRRRCAQGNPKLSEFEASCFDGKYITGDVTADYLSQLAAVRDVARGEMRCRRRSARAGARPATERLRQSAERARCGSSRYLAAATM